MSKSRWFAQFAGILAAFLLMAEFALREFGFGKGAIYVRDPDYEYMHAPNQYTKPFGNLLQTNQFGMRSRKLESNDDVHVLVLGDSVINGGNPMPQEAIATTLLERDLQSRCGPRARALNISAGSWGPDNAAAFLRKHGLFGTHAVIAVFSSHDLGDIMTHEPIVGKNPSLADAYPKVVLVDTWQRYVWPRVVTMLRNPESRANPLEIDKFTGHINPGWRKLRDICKGAGVPFRVVLHKERTEFLAGDFNAQGHALLEHLHDLQVTTLIESGFTIESYRDSIHLSAKGHADLARVLESLVNDMEMAQVSSLEP